MGNGIAHVAALAGVQVVLSDISEDRLAAGLEVTKGNLARQVAKGKVTEAENSAAALNRISTSVELTAMTPCVCGD
jgi:3-hydroxybutyryl-CoA dehydrogenase